MSETLKSTISNIYPDEISRKILVTVVKLSPVLASADDGGGSSLQKTLVIVDISLLNDETNIDEGLDQMKSILDPSISHVNKILGLFSSFALHSSYQYEKVIFQSSYQLERQIWIVPY